MQYKKNEFEEDPFLIKKIEVPFVYIDKANHVFNSKYWAWLRPHIQKAMKGIVTELKMYFGKQLSGIAEKNKSQRYRFLEKFLKESDFVFKREISLDEEDPTLKLFKMPFVKGKKTFQMYGEIYQSGKCCTEFRLEFGSSSSQDLIDEMGHVLDNNEYKFLAQKNEIDLRYGDASPFGIRIECLSEILEIARGSSLEKLKDEKYGNLFFYDLEKKGITFFVRNLNTKYSGAKFEAGEPYIVKTFIKKNCLDKQIVRAQYFQVFYKIIQHESKKNIKRIVCICESEPIFMRTSPPVRPERMTMSINVEVTPQEAKLTEKVPKSSNQPIPEILEKDGKQNEVFATLEHQLN